MDITDILLITVTLILIGTVGISVWRLMKYSDVYPIKQLSPRVTAMIAIAIGLSCCLLAGVALFIPKQKRQDNAAIDICCLFYVFLREVAIIGFNMRCFRICIAYSKCINCIPIIRLFSSEMLICLATCLFSLILPLVQIIERYAMNQVAVSEFFHFFSVEGASRSFSLFLWIVDNGIFFCVLALSVPINNKFKFIKSLVLVFIMYRLEAWYKLIYIKISNPASMDMQQYYYFVPILINIVCLVVLIWPTLRPKYELPLPSDVIITNHNMLFKHKEAYTILFKFARHLENTCGQHDETRQFACKYLQIYTELIIARRKIATQQLDGSSIEIEQSSVYQFLEKVVIPKYASLQILQTTTSRLFQPGKISVEGLRPNIRMHDLDPLNNKLLKVIKYIYGEWLHTISKRELKKELEANTPIISKMFQLEISIT